MLANLAMLVKTSLLLASRKIREAGIITSWGRSNPGGARFRERSVSSWSSVLPSAETATFVRSLLRVTRSSDRYQVSGLVRQLDRIRPCLVRTFKRGESPPFDEMILRRTRLGSLGDRAAHCCSWGRVSATACIPPRRGRSPAVARRRGRGGTLPSSHRHSGPRRTGRKRRALRPVESGMRPQPAAEIQDRGVSLTTSTPRGILNMNWLSAMPTFSFKFVKANVDVPPARRW